ncbi:retrovirus-related pol polyprotein LINE-1 [Tanacetum coccineum]
MLNFDRFWHVIPSGAMKFEVRHGSISFAVDERSRTCGCRLWQLSGIPCEHAIAVIYYLNINPDNYISEWYKKKVEFEAFSVTSTRFGPPPLASGVSFYLAEPDPSIHAATATSAGRIEPSLNNGNLRSCFPGRGGLGGSRKTRRDNRVAAFRKIRVGSWNLGSLTGKRRELADALERHRVDIACFQEGNGYKLLYSGSPTARNGVGVILKACLKDKVVHVIRCSDMIITLMLVIDGETINVISAYVPQVGLSEVEKKTFWDSLDKVVREVSMDQRVILGGDLNGHIGATTEGYEGVHEGFRYGVRNEEGRAILDFAIAHGLVVVNSHFKKRDHHLVTFQSGGRCTQIDYLMVRKGDLKLCKDHRVFPQEACSSQHNLLALDILGDTTEAFRSRVVEGVSTRVKALVAFDASSMWNALASIIKDAAKDTLGVVIGTSKTHTARRESWWLCEEVQAIVKVKQARFRELLSCREGNEEERLRAQERIAKARERRRRNLGDICFIKDEEGRTIMDEEEIKKRWGEYFSSLFNAREPEGHEEDVGPSRQPHPECYYSRISQAEVRTALRKMGRNKAVGPDQIPIEAWRSLGNKGIFWLTSLFNKIFTSAKMLKEWRLSEVIPIFKNKGDAQVCSNYRVEAIHLIRSLMDKYKERQRDLHMAFLDLEKAYDSVSRELIWKTLVDKGSSRRYIKGSAISPYLFALILDELSMEIHEDIPWCLIFADDIVLVSESAKGLNIRLENWIEALEDNGLRVSREKTEYLRCDFGNREIAHNEEVDVCIGDKILQPKESFRYLGSMLHKSGRIDEDVSNRIKAAWMKWRAAT